MPKRPARRRKNRPLQRQSDHLTQLEQPPVPYLQAQKPSLWKRISIVLNGINKTLAAMVSALTILTLLGIIIILPNKPALSIHCIFLDEETQKIIPNTRVTTDLTPGHTMTATSGGTLDFKVKGKPGEQIRIYAWADGYEPKNEYKKIESSISINMIPKNSKN